jgi:hypothetical protein
VNSSWVDVQTITLDVSAKPSLQPGEEFCYNYDIPFTPVAGAQYRNAGVAAITNLEGASEGQLRGVEVFVPFTLATAPTASETDETATLNDLLVCPAGFTCSAGPGPWTLTGTQTLNYAIQVTNVNAPCGHTAVVDNTAELTEGDSGTKHNDSESVTVTTPKCEEPPPPDFQGCTPGYWKQKQHFGSWVGYIPTGSSASKYNTVFGVNLFSANTTLLTALGTGGGGIYRFGRHSTAALLSASNGGVSYGMTPAQVIAAVQAAVASGNFDAASDEFERRNERQCPLGRAD